MRILLIGSTGFVGSHLTPALMDLHHEIIPISRATGFDLNDVSSADDWQPLLNDIDVVINCVGIIAETRTQTFEQLHKVAPTALFEACKQRHISKVIQISALGADEHAFTPYQLSRKAADDVLRASGLDWTILQPSLIYGARSASFRMFKLLATFPLISVPGKGGYHVQPVHIHDVVAAILESLSNYTASHQTIALVGATAMPYKDWLQAIRRGLGKSPARIIPIPFAVLLPLSKLIAPLFPLFSTANLKMLRAGNHASEEGITALLGRTPLSVGEGLQR